MSTPRASPRPSPTPNATLARSRGGCSVLRPVVRTVPRYYGRGSNVEPLFAPCSQRTATPFPTTVGETAPKICVTPSAPIAGPDPAMIGFSIGSKWPGRPLSTVDGVFLDDESSPRESVSRGVLDSLGSENLVSTLSRESERGSGGRECVQRVSRRPQESGGGARGQRRSSLRDRVWRSTGRGQWVSSAGCDGVSSAGSDRFSSARSDGFPSLGGNGVSSPRSDGFPLPRM